MRTKAKLITTLAILTLSFLFQSVAFAKVIRVTSFNVEWYGSKGGPKVNPKHRDRKLRSFLNQYGYNQHEVLVFQEIVDMKRMKERVLQDKYECTSYDSSRKNHQHVMICYSKDYQLNRDTNDDNYAIEDVQLGNPDYRPAVHGVLADEAGPILRIVGVHLKAQPKSFMKRLEQAEKISEYLTSEGTEIKTIILGDFNAFVNERNDDIQSMNIIFANNDLRKIENKDPYTYRKGRYKSQLDHMWVTSDVKTTQADAFDACQDLPQEERHAFLDIKHYNKYISDHCPLTVELEVTDVDSEDTGK